MRWTSIINNILLKPFGIRIVRTNDDHKFSLCDEESILLRLINKVGNVEKFYVDIGASDGIQMSNTLHLAKLNWNGLCYECDSNKFAKLANFYQNYPKVNLCCTKVTPLNVCDFFKAYGVSNNFGILSIDVDSYDYFILDALLCSYRPSIICAEINEKIPPPLEFTILFKESYAWDVSHFYGMSICQLEKLCKHFDYALVQLEYNNAFLISKKLSYGEELTAKEAYESGYLRKKDRKEKFPWNKDMECILNMTPKQSVDFLKKYFKKYEGKYSLSYNKECV